MTTVVDTHYQEFTAIRDLLDRQDEISLRNSLEANYRRSILLSAASLFEHMLTEAVLEFAAATTQSSLLPSLIKVKAIARQYHSWFDWDKNNINKFVSLFGDDFRAFMANRIKAQELEKAVTDFMTIGRDRNRLVHENFAAGYLEATTEEIYSTYQSALRLVNDIPQALHACSAFLVGAKEESTDI